MTLSTVECVCLLGFIQQYLINYVSVRIYTTTSGPQRSSSGSGTKLGKNHHFFHKVKRSHRDRSADRMRY